MEFNLRKWVSGLVLVVAGMAVLTLAYVYVWADEYDRACGIANLFETDYSREISRGVEITYEDTDVRLDLRKLTNWKTACLTSVYPGDFVFYFRPEGDRPTYSSRIGKSQCRNAANSISLML